MKKTDFQCLHIYLLLYLAFYSASASSFNGIAEYGEVTSREIYLKNNERVTEVCFTLKTQYNNLIGLDFQKAIGDYQNQFSEDSVSQFSKFSDSGKYGFSYNFDNLRIKVHFDIENSSLKSNSVQYTSSIFERDFNTERKNGQVSYHTAPSNENSDFTTINTCEVYFFNSLATPEELVSFLLSTPLVGYYEHTLTINFEIEVTHTRTGALISKYSKPINIDYRIPILGLEDSVTSEFISLTQKQSRELLTNNFNQALSNVKELRLEKQKLKMNYWHQSNHGGTTSSSIYSIQELLNCNPSQRYIGEKIGISSPIRSYNSINIQNGCSSRKVAILQEEIECAPWMQGRVCDVPSIEGSYYIFQDYRNRTSVSFLNDTEEKTLIPQVQNKFKDTEIYLPNPETCTSGLGNHGKIGTSAGDISFVENFEDGRFVFEDVYSDIVLQYSRDSNHPSCTFDIISKRADFLSCHHYRNGNLLCSTFWKGVLHGLLTQQGVGLINFTMDNEYIDDTDNDNLKDYIDQDDDNDGLPDNWEKKYSFNSKNPNDANLDPDGDGLSNLEEYLNNINPRRQDTDGDGINDAEELKLGEDPNLNKAVLIVILNHILL